MKRRNQLTLFVLILSLNLMSIQIEVMAQASVVNVKFDKFQLWNEFYSEGVTTADVNKDGKTDILAGARWFQAPDWKVHNIWTHHKFDYTKGYSDSFLNYTMDVNEDDWIDLIVFDFPGKEVYWYENPRGEEIPWRKNLIDSTAFNESPMLVDINGDGKKDLVFSDQRAGRMAWYSSSVKNKKVIWKQNPISEGNSNYPGMFSHGLGWGDINSDGINDVIIRGGWWEAPKIITNSPWKFHEVNLGENCAQMLTYDYDQDGDNDVLSSSAHDYGVWWHEQIFDKTGNGTFKTHTIDSSFSEVHSMVLTDVNNDGALDFITGKRFYAHQGGGPGGQEPAVLFWFELVKDTDQKPNWIRHLIDTNSGVGIQFVAEDLNTDGKVDIIISNKKGVFYFQQK